MTQATVSFGAYLLQPIFDDLLVCCGNSPGNEAGCQIFRSSDGAVFHHEFTPSEQGGNVDGQLVAHDFWMCGQDPDPDDWSLGNIYHRSSGGNWTKIRTLPLTIHSLGLWHDGTALYVGTGGHTGDNVTWKGRVLKSTDGGYIWSSTDVNNYRIYDVCGLGDKLYAVGLDYIDGSYLYNFYVSDNAGINWTKIFGVVPAVKPRLVFFRNMLVGAQVSLTGLFTIETSGNTQFYNLPFTLRNHWNVMADGGDDHFYVLAVNGVYRSADLKTWHYYASITNPISITLWPGVGLMVSDISLAARIWKVPIQ